LLREGGFLLGMLAVVVVYGRAVSFGATPIVNISLALLFALSFCVVVFRWSDVVRFSGGGSILFSVVLLVGLSPLSAFFGFINGYEFVQIAGDTLYLYLQFGFFLVGRFVVVKGVGCCARSPRDFSWMLIVVMVQVLVLILGRFLGLSIGVSVHLLLAVFCSFLYMNSFRGWWIWLPLLLYSVVSLNRSYLFGVLVVFPILLAIGRRRPKVFVFVLFAFLACVLSFFVIAGSGNSGRSLDVRIMQVYSVISGEGDYEDSLSLHQRVYEYRRVIDELKKDGFALLFGRGAGASMNMIDAPDDAVRRSALLGEGLVHNIHFLWGALLFRYGMFGVLSFATMMFGMFGLYVAVYRDILRGNAFPEEVFWVVYVFAQVGVWLFASNGFFTAWPAFFGIGYLVEMRKMRGGRRYLGNLRASRGEASTWRDS
jgi:hypothetical protein